MKSLPPDAPFDAFVRTALDAIGRDVPWAFTALLRALAHLTALIVVDGEPALVRRNSANAVDVFSRHGKADVVCVTTSNAILDLLHGREALVDALDSERIELVGNVDATLSFNDVLEAFLHGAVRSRAFDELRLSFEARAIRRDNPNEHTQR